MVAQFLRADFAVVRAMLQALIGAGGKRAAMDAAAKSALSEEDCLYYDALMRAIKTSRNKRNDFVHHLWGISPDIPDALLLLDPTQAIASQFAIESYISDHASGVAPLIKGIKNNPMVYFASDLSAAEAEDSECNRLIWSFIQCVFRSSGGVCSLDRTELSRIPAIQLAL